MFTESELIYFEKKYGEACTVFCDGDLIFVIKCRSSSLYFVDLYVRRSDDHFYPYKHKCFGTFDEVYLFVYSEIYECATSA